MKMNNVGAVILGIVAITALAVLVVRIKDILMERAFEQKRKLVLEYVDVIMSIVPSRDWGWIDPRVKKGADVLINFHKKDD